MCYMSIKDFTWNTILKVGGLNLGGDSIGSRSDAAASDTPTSEESAGGGPITGGRQREDGGADIAAGGDDGADHGRRFSDRSHSAPNRGYELSHRRFHRQQHIVHLPLLAFLLHRRLSAGNRRLRRRLICDILSLLISFLELKCTFHCAHFCFCL